MFMRKPGILLSILGLMLLLVPSAAAQMSTTSSIVSGAITVVGEGSASAPADWATVIIVIGGNSNVYIDPMTIEPDSVQAATAVDVTPVVDALVASGIPADNVEITESTFQGEWGPGMPATPVTLMVTVPQPSVDQLSAMLELVRTTAAAEDLFVNQFGVIYNAEDCRTLRQQARADAVAQAREQAEDQAAALETTVGSVVASRDTLSTSMGFGPMNNCNSFPAAIPLSMKYSAAPFDPAQPAEVTVFLAVEVSFELP